MKSLEELRKIREKVKKDLDARNRKYSKKIIVGMGTCGIAAGARETMNAFSDILSSEGVEDVSVTATGCAGFCDQEPLVDVEIEGEKPVRYKNVSKGEVARIVQDHIIGGKPAEDLIFS